MITVINPCLTTSLTLPTTLNNVVITAMSGVGDTQTFSPATDSRASTASLPGLCDVRVYTIVEAIPQGFITITPPAAGLNVYTDNWSLTCQTNDLTVVGTHNVTLKATLSLYAGVPFVTKTFQVIVVHICATTSINSQTFTPSDYQISKFVTTAQTILSFTMNTDTQGQAFTNAMICEIKTYSTNYSWLTVLPPANPLTQQF
jgi:hypothetical protein